MLNEYAHGKPLSYPSTKCFLQYLNVEKRLLLTHRCPSLYRAEKTVPLHIDFLLLASDHFVINNIQFSWGIIRQSSAKRKLLTAFKRDNANGGLPYDLDKYGAEDKAELENLSPGDIRIRDTDPDNQEVEEVEVRLMREDAKTLKKLKKLEKPNKGNLEEIVQLESKLFPWKNRRGNTRDCFPRYIKFQVKSEEGKYFKTEYLEYNKKLHETMKYLTAKFFGGREIIGVQHLEVDLYNTVLRLPVNLKLRIKQKMSIGGNVADVINPLGQILGQFPSLDIVEVKYHWEFRDEKNFDHPLIRTAKSLEIVNYGEPDQFWFTIVPQIKSEIVSTFGGYVDSMDLGNLAATILENRREIGTVYKIGLNEPKWFDDMYFLLHKHHEELQIGGEIRTLAGFGKKSSFEFTDLVIPMINKTSELHIYCGKNDEHDPNRYESPRFFVYFEVTPFETCDKSEFYKRLSICILFVLTIALIGIWVTDFFCWSASCTTLP
ncbi:hypothetical protein CAEBREN_07094 [Caenorhabditis brenneri]|uniref:Uncharacterized protein n=1 Tax=Caenorhabditis brenneri TaxID=135651 RepID=G0NWE7_CAEBE|nr:hypothetical protein CAEBREN_07094 [Caenorhabditis brenneri]